ncbi:hypothetical protein N499_1174 [Wolbachia pipientis wVitA]|nr:hypothetical protein N499_1174 [Wolbachia pipientis wVitA]RLT60481.1 hypothetical protein WANA13_1282 [Wolbachia endosymbiont of Drosophila ananassae]RLT60651.1 hypothetical protein WANA31_0937 [Wolbachia endosymbiont of Drosophila ananassae]RLT62314.1 hypothetical protein WANA34_1017 [Wolbachia endosymbiont of Drosophila ananassae]
MTSLRSFIAVLQKNRIYKVQQLLLFSFLSKINNKRVSYFHARK